MGIFSWAKQRGIKRMLCLGKIKWVDHPGWFYNQRVHWEKGRYLMIENMQWGWIYILQTFYPPKNQLIKAKRKFLYHIDYFNSFYFWKLQYLAVILLENKFKLYLLWANIFWWLSWTLTLCGLLVDCHF